MQEPRGVARVWMAGWEAQEGVTQRAAAPHYTVANAIFGRLKRTYAMDMAELRDLVVWWWEFKSKKFQGETFSPSPTPLCGCVEEFRAWMKRHEGEVKTQGLVETCRKASLQFLQDEWQIPGHWQQRQLMTPASLA